MAKKAFSLGKTETGILRLVEKNSSEEDIIRKVLGEGLASSRHIVKGAIDRLIDKKLISRGSKDLALTRRGSALISVFRDFE